MKQCCIISVLLLVISSCTLLPEPSALHDLGIVYVDAHSESINPKKPQPIITVESPLWLTDSRIHYRLMYSDPTQVRSYTLDRWIAPPAELFEQLLISGNNAWSAPLTINLYVFEQQFDTPGQAKVVMQFKVIQSSIDNSQINVNQEFKLQRRCSSPDAKGAVTGLAELAKEAVIKIQAWVNANSSTSYQ